MSIQRSISTCHFPNKKKNFSYAALISEALLNSPGNRLTLKEIYNYISTNYLEFTSRKKGWQNSIRHNLSLNKAFFKEPKVKGTPGKGSYWTIDPVEAEIIINKTESVIQANNRLRRGYGHTNQTTFKRKSPYLDAIEITEETNVKNQNFSIFSGQLNDRRLNPFNGSLEAYFGMNQRGELDDEDSPFIDDIGYKQPEMSDYFRFE